MTAWKPWTYHLIKNVRVEDGHWLWEGRLDKKFSPVFNYYVDGKVIGSTPRRMVFLMEKGVEPPGPLFPQCEYELCIHPDHQANKPRDLVPPEPEETDDPWDFGGVKKMLPCSRCDEKFMTTIHQRTCQSCKRDDSHSYTGVDYGSFLQDGRTPKRETA